MAKEIIKMLKQAPPVKRFCADHQSLLGSKCNWTCKTYDVEESGKIWSNNNPGSILKGTCNSKGYLQLSDKTLIHEAVAICWVERKNKEDVQVKHVDGDKTNNHAQNLEWS